MHALVEEHSGRAVQLRNDNSFRSVDHECAGRCHVRNVTEVNILDFGIEILVLWICA